VLFVVESHQNIALLWSYVLDLTVFQAIFLFLKQNQKYKVVHALAYLSHLNILVRPNGKYDCISRNSIKYVTGDNLISMTTDANAL
jgi:hypothetical protein